MWYFLKFIIDEKIIEKLKTSAWVFKPQIIKYLEMSQRRSDLLTNINNCVPSFFSEYIYIYHFFFNTSKLFLKILIDLCLLSNFSQKLIKPSQMSDPSDVPSGCQIQHIRGLCFSDCLISVCDMGSDAVFNLWCIRNPGWTTGLVITWNSQKKTSTNHRGGAIAQRVNLFLKT